MNMSSVRYHLMKIVLLLMRILAFGGCVVACGACAFAQGAVYLNNRVPGIVVTHVYGPDPCYPRVTVGNGPDDFPAGTTDWSAYTPLSGFEWTVQLWYAVGANQPLSSLQAATPTTTFRTGAAAGFINPVTVSLPGTTPGGSATVQLRVWDSSNGATWDTGLPRGMSPIFNVDNLGGNTILPPFLTGLQSFSLYPHDIPWFHGFITQPTNQTVLPGGTATFVAEACANLVGWQWYHDGVPIDGAYGPWYQITNVRATDAGTYWVEVSVGILWTSTWVTNTSAVATLTVLAPPIITSQPRSQTAEAGARIRFSAGAQGLTPLSYTWFFNGAPIQAPASTEGTLLLTNVQLAQAGAYTVVVANSLGAATSAPALLSVIPPVPRKPVPALNLTGQPGSSLNLDFAGSVMAPVNWTLLDAVPLTNTSQWYVDRSSGIAAQRLYRAWQTNIPSGEPALDIALVPAITLTGNVGDSLRLDYINQFGPIDAWVTLDTLTLTNTSQLYFDVSAQGQRPRLYRLVPVP